MINTQQADSRLLKIAASLLTSVLMNFIFFIICFWEVARLPSNDWLHGKRSFGLTPFTFIFCWMDELFPQYQLNFGLIVLGNVILCSVLSYFFLYYMEKLYLLQKDIVKSS